MSTTDPVIEIAGVWIPNKGAEIMAWTAVTELSRRLPGARFVSQDQGDPAIRAAIGLVPTPLAGKGTRRATLGMRLRAALRRQPLPLAPTHVVDVSGFAYGDDWGAAKAQRRLGPLVRAGLPFYLMPQAFGPFEDAALARVMSRMLPAARLVAARDGTSEAHLAALATGARVERLPDMTVGLDTSARTPARPDTAFACLIPNSKLVSSGTMSAEAQIDLLTAAGDRLAAAGLTPVVTLHEPRADRAIGTAVANRLGTEPVAFEDARDLKAFVGQAEIVLSARFHGLVNALSAGVPALAIGWSHKYAELMADFGLDGTSYEGAPAALLAALDRLLADPAGREATRAELLTREAAMATRLSEMWDRVAADIAAR